MKLYYTQIDVAEAARTSASYLSSCIRKGAVPAPLHQVGLRKYYNPEDVDRIVQWFEDRRRKKIISLEEKQRGAAGVQEGTQG